ncbi:hypothetical protein G647_09698 [Cladophialophora carrionii CBS 160.54]|uniref:Uncharacterized protein n=1 Tax=Cladophialophora carrionii CBS 160.54 TaxID=1279043 RepID=V9DNH2_9EURO|nr:uncharacterized protein G647_09698 [Cladophialophora carrionii CBS 160.54]ETI27507.1 hypothetical protein G647_09698 [Cladophialophora carrionii CBS 160.54]
MDDLDPSPRGFKRKRTGTYATRRRTLASSPAQAQAAQAFTTKGAAKAESEAAKQVVYESDDPTTDFPAVEEPLALESEEQARTPTSRRSSGGRQTTEDGFSDIMASAGTAGRPRGPRKSQIGAKQTARPKDTREDQAEPLSRRSSGRTRRPARRAGSAVDKLPEQTPSTSPVKNRAATGALSPQPKGILTPSRRGGGQRNGPRKSVVFHEDVDVDDTDEKQIEDHFGFKDIGSSRKKNGSPSTKSISESPEAREEDVFEDAPEYQDRARQHGAMGEADDDSISDEYPDTDDIPPTFRPTSKMVQAYSSLTEDENPHLTSIKVQVLSRLISRSQTPDNPARAIPAHLHHQYTTLHSLLSATVTAGESNSLLLLGSRGSGKSFLLENALADLSKSHSDDFHVVRLNGFFQTDDKLALKEIWHQLGREMAVPEDETSEVSSYADTMASLLSLLSHPEELGHSDVMEVDGAYNSREHGPARTSKSIIFIMDEFDLFTTHPRQTLLYNLFDIAQAKKAPIAVIGCSTRMDVVDCLEKRVKSRFSHRWLHIPAAKSLVAFEEIAKDVLCLPVEGKEALGVAKEERDWRARWKKFIETQFLPSSDVQSMLKRTFSSTKSIPDVLAALYVPIATLAVPANLAEHPKAPSPSMTDTTTTALPSLLALLPHLPILHLSLLVSAARLETIYDVMIVNFTLVHKQYTDLLTRSRLQRSSLLSFNKGGTLTGAGLRTWNKDTARSAWEELALWEFIVPASGGGGRLGDEGLGGDGIVTRMFRVDATLDEVAWAVKQKLGSAGVGETLYKWCREI